MNIWKRILTITLVSTSCVGCDQTTKTLAAEYLSKNRMDSYFYDVLRIGYTENTGAFLGLGDSLSIDIRFGIFVVVVGIFLFGLLCYLVSSSKQNFYSLVALSFVFSGGISNFFDRVVNNGAVVDFLNIGFGSIRTGIFNVADMAILLGIFIFIFSEKKQRIVV
jgi:signal peptidase II